MSYYNIPKTASVLVLAVLSVQGFVPNAQTCSRLQKPLFASIPANDLMAKNFAMSREEVKPLFTLGEGEKEKVVNAFGVVALMASLVTGPIWMLAMSTVDMICRMNDTLDPNRAVFDYTGKIWSRIWLTMCMSRPTVSGDTDAVRQGQGACLYVANHASWLDIPIICTLLDPVFKFIAKAELAKVPCIGQQLKGGHHILIDRDDRRSQLRTFKEGIAWLKKGVPLMAFPEGQRSLDGRLMDFKGGIFSMATKANVPIVPISLSHTHAIMPANSLFPVQPGRGKLHIHIHKPIDPAGKTEIELAQLVRAALLSKMPDVQHPLPQSTPPEEQSEKEEGLKQIA